jgi:hypothetical protein
MKTIILLILSAFTAFAATTYPVLTDNANRTFSGGGTNLALLNGTNVFTGTNTFPYLIGNGGGLTNLPSASVVMNQNQFDSTSTNIKSGATFTNGVFRQSSGNALTVNTNALIVSTNDVSMGGSLSVTGLVAIPNSSASSLAGSSLRFGTSAAIGHSAGGLEMEFWANTAFAMGLDYRWLQLDTAYPIVWGTASPSGGQDAALRRYAAGVLGVDSSTSGAYRDLRLRTLLTYAQDSDPASSATFGQLYAKTNGATTEVYVMDGAGNVTQISPHARVSSPAPASVDAGDKTPIVIHHKNLFTGEQEWLHISAMARKLEQLTGEKFVWKRRIPDAEVRDWDAEQARLEAESDDEVKADRKRLREWEQITSPNKGPAPAVRKKYLRAPKPDFLQ